MPGIVIIGAQRSGTTSLHSWLCSHPDVAPFMVKEVHYFDGAYERGERWYRSRFPIGPRSRIHVEASPYMLFHPLAPGRGRDLPETTAVRGAAARAGGARALALPVRAPTAGTARRSPSPSSSRIPAWRGQEAVIPGRASRATRWYSYRSRTLCRAAVPLVRRRRPSPDPDHGERADVRRSAGSGGTAELARTAARSDYPSPR